VQRRRATASCNSVVEERPFRAALGRRELRASAPGVVLPRTACKDATTAKADHCDDAIAALKRRSST
jgi:hypothetical protein